MKIEKKEIFGEWEEFTLTNDQNMSVSVLNYGGIITKILVPDRNEKVENVVLGYKNYQDYQENPNYFGAIIGRVAGRIRDAAFEIDGKAYSLQANDGKNHLHGGPAGLHQVVWEATPFETNETIGVTLSHQSEEGGGYPGNLEITVTYTLTNDNQLHLEYTAGSDKTTPLALTNHTYFNLCGNLKDTVQDHFLTMNSSSVAELDAELIPTGNITNVEGTRFEFRHERVLGESFNGKYNGYDHYFIFDEGPNEVQVELKEPTSGRVLTVRTNQPGMVMYTANDLESGQKLREGETRKHLGVCFETKGTPASLHHQGFPCILLHPGETYKQHTVFTFQIDQ
ncbi:aldose epimerase family protein [Oceanobacillus saliphilus]|uniref:aldose epimerase family protein n=1 Tax=Oceanobacillus saliphilus TaxID=2925834 RepID=UPI00201DCB5D|nr:aldose epimerase family protein [Oceanobacillus saliphilus]